MIVYFSKPMIMRINPFVGISRMRRFRMVDMCKGKRNLWLRGTDDVLVVGLHMVGKRVKVSSLNNVTSFLALYFFFHLIHPSHILFATPLFSFSSFSFILSFSYFSLSLLFYIFFFFLSFFLFPYSYFSLYFSLSWQLFKDLNPSLSCMHTIWNFK
jgi:hypothetical protein